MVLESLGEEEYIELHEIYSKYVVFETPNQTYFSLSFNGKTKVLYQSSVVVTLRASVITLHVSLPASLRFCLSFIVVSSIPM